MVVLLVELKVVVVVANPLLTGTQAWALLKTGATDFLRGRVRVALLPLRAAD